MARIEYKPTVRAQCSGQLGEQFARHLVHSAASMADQVNVLVFVRGVGRRTVPEMGVPHQIHLLEQVERAVDRGDVDRRRGASNVLAHLFWSGVSHAAHRFEDELTLWGAAQAVFVQGPLQRGLVVGLSFESHTSIVGSPVS